VVVSKGIKQGYIGSRYRRVCVKGCGLLALLTLPLPLARPRLLLE